jgi:hypothetical protein
MLAALAVGSEGLSAAGVGKISFGEEGGAARAWKQKCLERREVGGFAWVIPGKSPIPAIQADGRGAAIGSFRYR